MKGEVGSLQAFQMWLRKINAHMDRTQNTMTHWVSCRAKQAHVYNVHKNYDKNKRPGYSLTCILVGFGGAFSEVCTCAEVPRVCKQSTVDTSLLDFIHVASTMTQIHFIDLTNQLLTNEFGACKITV